MTCVCVMCWFTNIDTTHYKAEVTCVTNLFGNFSKTRSYSMANVPPSKQLVVKFEQGFRALNLKDGDMPEAVTFLVGLNALPARSAAHYPNMVFNYSLPISAYLSNQTGGHETVAPLVLWLHLAYMPMYQVQENVCVRSDENTTLVVQGVLAIDTYSQSLLIAMQVFMWFMALFTFAATLVSFVWRFMRNHDLSESVALLLPFSGSLLFALPTMRGLWPAAPPSGTVYDVLNIYSQLMLIAFAVILQLAFLVIEKIKGIVLAWPPP